MANGSFEEASIFIAAHADDCQLFMQPHMFRRLVAANNKSIFIITTAGDSGFDEKFWRAREEGFKSSLRYCLAPVNSLKESDSVQEVNGHLLTQYKVNSHVCYFLRLPDGNITGKGFASNGYQNLEKLKKGEIRRLSSVDKRTFYDNWDDIIDTLEEIIRRETIDISKKCLFYPDPDKNENPGDHPDHFHSGLLAASLQLPGQCTCFLSKGYCVDHRRGVLSHDDLFWKAGMFAVYEKTVYDATCYSTLREGEQQYLKWCLSSCHYIQKQRDEMAQSF